MLRDLIINVSNFIGFKTTRRLVVFCSDDWGGIRIKNTIQQGELKSLRIDVENNRFNLFDTLESNKDLEDLFNVLTKYKDMNGNHPVFTAVMNVANPDFQRIKSSGYENYFFEPFTKTLERYPNSDKVYQLYLDGIRTNIFKPQFHGREHLQVTPWLKALQQNDPKTCLAFDKDFFFLSKSEVAISMAGELADAYDFMELNEVEFHKSAIVSGITLFKEYFNYLPVHFTAPVMKFSSSLMPILVQSGIRIVDVPRMRYVPIGNGRYRRKFHFMGQRFNKQLCYINRNAVFESNMPQYHWESTLKDIENAFQFNKPAIISNHRACFVGGLDERNKSEGLQQLNKLLQTILQKWPDVEFVDMDDLAKIILNK